MSRLGVQVTSLGPQPLKSLISEGFFLSLITAAQDLSRLRFQLIQAIALVALRNDDTLLGKLLQEGFRAAQGGAQGFGERKQVAGGVVCEIVDQQLALG